MIELPKRLSKGKGIIGPEWFGCFNTGKRPVIFKTHTGNKAFIVSTELAMSDARHMNLFGQNAKKRVLKTNSGKAYLTDSYKAAKKKFNEMCKEVVDYNDGERNKAIALKKLWKDMKGYSPEALSLAMELN